MKKFLRVCWKEDVYSGESNFNKDNDIPVDWLFYTGETTNKKQRIKMEEVYHKKNERLDIVVFLNGLALFASELKCNVTGQSVGDAMKNIGACPDVLRWIGNL